MNLTIEFGLPDWGAAIGGGFGNPEAAGTDSWRWLGARPGWVILPEEFCGQTLACRLSAAPLAPFAHPMEMAIHAGGRVLARAIAPADAAELSASADVITDTAAHSCDGLRIEARWRRLPLPFLIVGGGTEEVRLEYEPESRMQDRAFEWRCAPATGPIAMRFLPGYSIPEPVPAHERPRDLSFRMMRLAITAA